MSNKQDSRINQANSAYVFSASADFPLDTSLDAELSPYNFANDSSDGCPPGTAYTPFDSFTQSRQQSGSETTSTSRRFDQSTSAFNTHVHTPTVILQRPSIDTNSNDKALSIEPLEAQEITAMVATPIPNALSSATIADSTTATAGSSDTSLSLHNFGNLNLDMVPSGESGMVDYANHLFPLSPSGGNSTDMIFAPSSPVSEFIPPAKLEYIGGENNYYSVPVSPTLLQTTYGGDESPLSSISSASSLPPPIFFNEQQQQHSPWSTDVSQNPSPSPRAATPNDTSSLSTPLHTSILKSNHSDDTEQQQHSHQRSPHSAVEKKYRNNINDRITELKDAVPALRHARVKKDSAIYLDDNKNSTTTSQHSNSKNNENDDLDEPIFMDGVAVATKLNKATILQKATEYVHYLRQVNNERKQDLDTLLYTIETQVPGGQDICNQYRHHVIQREALQQQRSASNGKKI